MMHILQWLYTYVANFCSQCFICFSDVCCKCVYLDVAYVSHICCKCFIWMLRMFCNDFQQFSFFCKCFRHMFQVFHLSSDVCCKCFIYLLLYVASVTSRVDLVLHMLLWLYMYVSSACFKCFIYFRRMLQVFHLDVSKVYLGETHAATASALL